VNRPPISRLLLAIGMGVFLFTSCGPDAGWMGLEVESAQLSDDYLEAWKSFYPTSAARLGLEEYVGQAEDRSLENIEGWLGFNQEVKERIAGFPSDLSIDLLIDLRLLENQVDTEIRRWSEVASSAASAQPSETILEDEIELREIETVRGIIAETSEEYWRENHPEVAVPTDVGGLVDLVSAEMEDNRPSSQQESLELFRRYAAEAEAFVEEKGLATLPADRTLRIVLTPESAGPAQRIGFVNSPPPFDPDPMTTLSLPTIPDSFPEGEKEDFYRSFNNHFNKFIIIHELFPGHYMQLKIASGNPRLIRTFFPYRPYVEGWATLVEKLALDAGWDDFNQLTYLAHLRKRLENANRAYTSVQVHCFGWTEAQVSGFSRERAMLAPQFAESLFGRLERGPMQMTSYFMGKDMFNEVLENEMARLGDRFDVRAFTDVILNAGAVPIDMIPSLLASANR